MSRRVDWRSATGFTLIEMLVSTFVMVAIISAVFAVLNPAHGSFQSQPEVTDMQQRLRASLDAVAHDLFAAGAGTSGGENRGALVNYFAPILPYRSGLLGSDSDAGVFYRPDAITLFSVPWTAAQTRVARPLALTAGEVDVASAPNCPPRTPRTVCGFGEGDRLLVFDRNGARDVMTVTGVDDATVQVRYAGSLSVPYDTTAGLAGVLSDTYYLKTDLASSTFQLMHYDGYRSDLPLVDHVVSLRFDYFGDPQPPLLLPGTPLSDATGPWTTYGPRPPEGGIDNPDDTWPAGENCVFTTAGGAPVARLPALAAGRALVPLLPAQLVDGPWCPDAAADRRFDADLLRIRRVRVTVRVQASAALLRGPAGRLFVHGGTATAAERYVPDQEFGLDITPRNMSGGR